MAALIPSGMRAYTVQTSRVASKVAGFILPGNRVDVLMTLRGSFSDANGGGSTTTLLQAVEILAVGNLIDAPAGNQVNSNEVESVTLLVSPEQAARLDLGQAVGQLTLSLRNADDLSESDTQPATLADIRFSQMKPQSTTESVAQPPPVPQAREEPRHRPVPTIRTLRGQDWGEVRLVPAGVE